MVDHGQQGATTMSNDGHGNQPSRAPGTKQVRWSVALGLPTGRAALRCHRHRPSRRSEGRDVAVIPLDGHQGAAHCGHDTGPTSLADSAAIHDDPITRAHLGAPPDLLGTPTMPPVAPPDRRGPVVQDSGAACSTTLGGVGFHRPTPPGCQALRDHGKRSIQHRKPKRWTTGR